MSLLKKHKNLIKRTIITLFILIIYRIGCYLSIPGVDQSILSDIIANDKGGFFSMADLFSGGSLSRSSFFSLSVFPYISASLLTQMLSSSIGFDFFINLKKQGDAGQIRLNAYTKYIALIMGFSYALRYCSYIVSSNVNGFSPIYINKTLFFFVAIPHMLAGMMFLIWMGNQITKKGIGNGVSLIVFAGVISNLPSALLKLLETAKSTTTSTAMIIFIAFFIFIVSKVIIFEESYYKIPVKYPSINKFGTKSISITHYLPLKINNASIMPPIMSGTAMMAPQLLYTGLCKMPVTIPYLHTIFGAIAYGKPLYYLMYAIFLSFFTIVYTPIAFDPNNLAENLKKEGCILKDWRPGITTAHCLSNIIGSLSILSCLYLVILCVSVDALIQYLKFPIYFSGTSLMISVGVAIETYKSFKSYISGLQYERIAKKYGL